MNWWKASFFPSVSLTKEAAEYFKPVGSFYSPRRALPLSFKYKIIPWLSNTSTPSFISRRIRGIISFFSFSIVILLLIFSAEILTG